MVKHIAFTMYSVKDMKRARKFYEKALGLKMTHDFRGQWVEYHLKNGAFAITTMAKSVKPSSNSGGAIAFEVDSVDKTVAALKKKKVKVLVPPFATPVCRNAIVRDSEGNSVILHQKIARP